MGIGVRRRPDGRCRDRPDRPSRPAGPVPRGVIRGPTRSHAGRLAAQKGCARPVRSLLNFRCSFCSNRLDETHHRLREARGRPEGRAGARDPEEEAQVLRALEAAHHRRAGLPRYRRGRRRPAVSAGEHPLRAAIDRDHDQRRDRRLGEGVRGRGDGERHRGQGLPPLPSHKDNRQVVQAEGSAGREEEGGVADTGRSMLARLAKKRWRIR